MIRSPVTDSDNVKLVKRIHCDYIVNLYRRELDVEVGRWLGATKSIDLYECGDTGYRFYHPFSVAGDAGLYETLQRTPWYYAEGKEEHTYSLKAIGSRQRVLEVGCGSGIFLGMLRDSDCEIVGLELNAAAVEEANLRGIRVLRETVEQHAEKHRETYDVVATFQVLEHVVGVKTFLDSCLSSLKAGRASDRQRAE